jgi:hypothetical protein
VGRNGLLQPPALAGVLSPPKVTIEAASAAKAPADTRILRCPSALRMRVLAAFISSIASARLAILGRPRSLRSSHARLETDIAA